MYSSRLFFLSFFLFFLFSELSFAVESEAQREAIVTPRSKKFFRGKQSKQYLSLGGIYSSDYNSKTYQLNSRYLFQSDKFVNEMNFEHETEYADRGSGTNKKYGIKTSELYDLALSGKGRIKDSNNYGVFYHRSIYDEFSNYVYDGRIAAGLGHMFFGDKFEWDLSMSYHDVKEYGSEVDVVTSWRANFKITDNITFIQRAYWFFNHESIDNQFRSSIVYRIRERLSFEVRHNFEQRRYEEDNKNRVTNLVNRSVTIGLVFDLN
jgi:hypothetical protein